MTPARKPATHARAEGPYLILAAFWLDEDASDRVAAALRIADFPVPAGYPRGCVVAFRHEVATRLDFRHELARFDLAELDPFAAVTPRRREGS